MSRLGRIAARGASRKVLGLELGLVAMWVGLAVPLSIVTARVTDWNAMTDELHYERLALSIAQTGSLIPRLHGEYVGSLAQLYPALIAPWFSYGFVPESLRDAHIFNAWLMTSACIPAFLLAQRVTGRRWPAYALAFLTACVPWIMYSTMLLTEVVGYPVFVWALLAMHSALTRPSVRYDLLAVLGLAVAFFGRTQFFFLVGVLPVALVLYEVTGAPGASWRERARGGLRTALRTHRTLALVYAVFGIALLAVLASGRNLYFLSAYGSQLQGNLFPSGTAGAIASHVADLAFGVGILPLLVGLAWLYANAWRRETTAELHALACVGVVTVTIMIWLISAWDLHIGEFVLDRYLFYLAPLVLLAFFCALLDLRRPRWSLLAPVAIVAIGFAFYLQAEFLWSGRFPLSTDSPISWLYKPIADLGGGTAGASAILVATTLALAALFLLADRVVPHDRLTGGLTVVLLVAFPLFTALTFAKLFSGPSHSHRPLTQSQSGVLDWLDRAVGVDAQVTQVPYPTSTDFFVSQQAWRDLEFWNKSVRYGIRYPTSDIYADAVIWFANNPISFDPISGVASDTLTPYVVQSVSETRFRISGTVIAQREMMLIDAVQPWRAEWITSGLYHDGWMRPGKPARIRVFAAQNQGSARTRTLSLHLRPPPNSAGGPYTIVSNLGEIRGELVPGSDAHEQIDVCVPADAPSDVWLRSPIRTVIPGDQKSAEASSLPREGGLLIADMSIADEIGPPCDPG